MEAAPTPRGRVELRHRVVIEKLDLGDPPIVKIDTPDQAREFVRSTRSLDYTLEQPCAGHAANLADGLNAMLLHLPQAAHPPALPLRGTRR